MGTRDELRAAFTPVTTQRLLLRAAGPGDLDRCFEIHADPETYRFHPAGVASGRAEVAARLEYWTRTWRDHGYGVWAIWAAGELVGFGGLTPAELAGREVLNTYYRFAPAAWGHGYATEMVRTAYTLADCWLPGVPRVIRTRSGNTAARRVAEKLGLARCPELDDELVAYAAGW